jgi:cytochrome b subunit of formate dehydrogenase
MIGSLLVHAIHLAVDRRARTCIAGMRPTLEDLHELKERFRYFFGLRPTPPAAGALGYPEKMEYLALIWGSLLMAATGFVLWFNNLTMRWLPAWASDVSTTIHFYEAILATGSIVVWHFYFVIFDPVVYPMDTTWLTGKSPVARVKEREGYSLDPATEEKPGKKSHEENGAAAPRE